MNVPVKFGGGYINELGEEVVGVEGVVLGARRAWEAGEEGRLKFNLGRLLVTYEGGG